MNEEVFKMIDTLHARLDDVREVLDSLPEEAPQYAEKLDRIDDRIYLVQREIEAHAQSIAHGNDGESPKGIPASADADGAAGGEGSAPEPAGDGEAAVSQGSSGESGDKKEIFSDDMKENLADAGRAIGNIYRDGKEVVAELSGTMGDLKDIFSFGKRR